MAVTTVHAQLIRYTDSGTQVIVNLKSTGSDISIDRSSNTKLPSSVSTVQGLANVLGKLAFADTIADATTSASGLMSAAMVSKLNGIASGANAYNHPNSGVTAGTYRSVTVNAQGHVTTGSNPTTLAGYGITDAAAKSHSHSYLPLSGGSMTGAIHLRQPGSGSYNENIRMHVSSSNWTSIVMCGDDNTGDSGITKKSWGIYTYNGTFSIAKNGTNLNKASSDASIVCDGNNVWYVNGGVLITSSNYATYAAAKSHTHTKSQITDFPSSMPASDVYAWAKASSKPSYSWSEITGKPSTFTPASHSHNYAGSSSAGGAANSLAYFQNTSSTNVGQENLVQIASAISRITVERRSLQMLQMVPFIGKHIVPVGYIKFMVIIVRVPLQYEERIMAIGKVGNEYWMKVTTVYLLSQKQDLVHPVLGESTLPETLQLRQN